MSVSVASMVGGARWDAAVEAPARGGRVVVRSHADRARRMRLAKRLYLEAWNQGDMDALVEIMTDTHVHSDHIWNHGQDVVGRDKIAAGIQLFRKLYPDLEFTVTSTGYVKPKHLDGVDYRCVRWGAASGTIACRIPHLMMR